MNEKLILASISIAGLTFSFVSTYWALRERKKRLKLHELLRSSKKEKGGRKRDDLKLVSRALTLIKEGIVIMDNYGRIVFTNNLARELLGISKDDIGKPFYQAINNFDIVSMINESFNEPYRVWHEKEIGDSCVQVIFGSDLDEKVLILIDLTPMKKYEVLKKDFIANASHELKTPLASLKLSLEILEQECEGHPKAGEFIKKAIEKVDYMNQLIEDLLTLSRLESVNYVPRFTEINMKKFVDRVIKDFAELIERKNISIHCKVPKEIVIVSDEKMLYAVLKNLIDNGIKYNKEGGVLKITVKEIEDFVEIVVEDTGIGIPKSHLPFIFERFYRVERSRSKRFGGTGLGLSIVKLAVEKLGGTVEVESEEGKGSKFKITLPKEPVYSSKTTTLKPLAEK